MTATSTKIFKHYGVETSRLERDLTRALDRLKTGNARNPTWRRASPG